MVTNPISEQHGLSVDSIHLEYCGVERLPDIMRIMELSFSEEYGESWNNNQCRSMLSLRGTRLMIASVKQHPIGFLISRVVVGEEELLMIAVDPQYQQNGVGMAMLKHMLNEAGRNAVDAVFLEVRANNPAQELYRNLGFIKIGERSAYYTGANGEKFDANTYKLTLR